MEENSGCIAVRILVDYGYGREFCLYSRKNSWRLRLWKRFLAV